MGKILLYGGIAIVVLIIIIVIIVLLSKQASARTRDEEDDEDDDINEEEDETVSTSIKNCDALCKTICRKYPPLIIPKQWGIPIGPPFPNPARTLCKNQCKADCIQNGEDYIKNKTY